MNCLVFLIFISLKSRRSMGKIKRIALVVIDLKIGGAEKSTILLGETLQEMGYKVTLITINDIVELQSGLPVQSLQSRKYFLYNKISKFFQLRKYLRENHIDVVIDNRTRNSIGKEFFYFWVYKKFKKIYVIRSYFIDNYICKNSYLSQKLFRQVDHFAVVSKEIKEAVTFRLPNNKITTIYNYKPDKPILSLNHNLTDKSYLLFLGRFDNSSKDFVFLLNAYKISNVWKKGIQLVMLGKGPDKELLLNTIEDLKLNDYVRVLDAVPNPESYIKTALFTVITSNYEGFPRVIIESLSLGIPVVSTDFKSGPEEIIIHGVNGLRVSKDMNKFSWALNEMIDNKELYNRCRLNAVDSVSRFSKENFVSKWNKILDKVETSA